MKLTIKNRLILGFAILLGITTVIYLVGASNLKKLNARIDQITQFTAQRMKVAAKLNQDILTISVAEKSLLLSRTPEDADEQIAFIDGKIIDVNNKIELLRTLKPTPDGRINLDNFAIKWTEYQRVYGQIKNIIKASTYSATSNSVQLYPLLPLNSRSRAYELSSGKAQRLFEDALKEMTDIVNRNDKKLEADKEETDMLYENARDTMLMMLIACLLVAFLVSVWIVASTNNSIIRAQNAIRSVAEGNLNAEIDTECEDEIGQLLVNFKNMVGRLKEVITAVTMAADNIAGASQQMSSTSQQMSTGATEQAASAEEVAASMQEMSANIQQNTNNSQQTEKIATKAAQDIEQGGDVINMTVNSMKIIVEKISIIEEIARQTNLLALNAAVEAARAGEYGRGFAVVASEVRRLAERSQGAATEINELSRTGVNIAEKAGDMFGQIVPNIKKTSRLVQEISASSMEQSTGADQVNSVLQQLNQVIQQNAAASEEMASSAEELASQAELLRETVLFFKLENSNNKPKSSVTTNIKKTQTAKAPNPKKAIVTHLRDDIKTGPNLNMGDGDALDSEYEKF